MKPKIIMLYFSHGANYAKQYIYWGARDSNGNTKLKYPRFDTTRYYSILTSKKNTKYIPKMQKVAKKIFDSNSEAGATWNSFSEISSSPNLNLLFCVDGGGEVYKSVDSGVNWVLSQENFGRNSGADMFSNSNYLYILSTLGNEVWNSSDGANFAVVYNSFSVSPLVGSSDSNDNLYVTTGPSEVWKSEDNGLTWNLQGDFNGGATNDPKGLAIDSNDYIYAVNASDANYTILINASDAIGNYDTTVFRVEILTDTAADWNLSKQYNFSIDEDNSTWGGINLSDYANDTDGDTEGLIEGERLGDNDWLGDVEGLIEELIDNESEGDKDGLKLCDGLTDGLILGEID